MGAIEESIRRTAELSGMPLPEEIENKPELDAYLQYYLAIFLDLNTTRPIGMSEGPISILSVYKYCAYNGYNANITEAIVFHTMRLDQAYLKYKYEKMQREMKSGKAKRHSAT